MSSVLKKRNELLVTTGTGLTLTKHCAFCGSSGWLDRIKHKKDCVLANPAVTHVRMYAVRARIVLHTSDGKYWWTSPISGHTYDIDRRGSCWVLSERSTGRHVMDDVRLRDIRTRMRDFQGNL